MAYSGKLQCRGPVYPSPKTGHPVYLDPGVASRETMTRKSKWGMATEYIGASTISTRRILCRRVLEVVTICGKATEAGVFGAAQSSPLYTGDRVLAPSGAILFAYGGQHSDYVDGLHIGSDRVRTLHRVCRTLRAGEDTIQQESFAVLGEVG